MSNLTSVKKKNKKKIKKHNFTMNHDTDLKGQCPQMKRHI